MINEFFKDVDMWPILRLCMSTNLIGFSAFIFKYGRDEDRWEIF